MGGSRIRSFFGISNNSSANLQAAKPYHSIAASDPPVKGSYPVAGNGPNVLEEIQRKRAKRQSTTESFAAPAPNVLRRRADSIQRPSTAPHDGTPGGGHTRSKNEKVTRGRTLSGFSMKSPPSIFSSSRRNSLKSSIDSPPLPSNYNPAPPAIPRDLSPQLREIKTYMPTSGSATPNPNQNSPAVYTFAQQHSRTSSQHSHKPHLDLLDAHSNIKGTREASLHRYKASGLRIYGEDVADRNINAFGERSYRDSKLDLSSPEFSYLNSVYIPPKTIRSSEPHPRVGSALGHAVWPDGSGGDDAQPSGAQLAQPRPNSLSTTSTRSESRPTSVYPPRVDSAAAAALSYRAGPSRDDRRSTQSNGTMSSKSRAMPLSSSGASVFEEPPARDHGTRQNVSTPPIPERGRTRPVTTTTTTTSTTSTLQSNLPPVAPAARVISTTQSRPSSTAGEVASSKTKRRSMSAASQSPIVPATINGGTSSRKGSVSFATFNESQKQPQASSRQSATSVPNRNGMIIEGQTRPLSLEGIVNLTNTVDSDVTKKQPPAVVHEHITPIRREIRQEPITREFHNHNVYHRVLPIETEILPTKHYVKGPDGRTLIEISESTVPKHKVTGRLDQSWHISKPGPSMHNNTITCETADLVSTDSAPDGPVIGLARGEPRTRPRGNSKASSLKSPQRDPGLSNKKDYTTKEAIPRTEYVWRHRPIFETATGETQPVYIGAGIGDLSGSNYHSEEDDESGAEFSDARSSTKGEEELLFRDSGYGAGGMLPGLTDIDPSSTMTGSTYPGRVVG